MTDMIGGQQESACPICIFASKDVNTRNPTKQQSYEQLASAIICGFGLHVLSVSPTRHHRKAIFQADSFL